MWHKVWQFTESPKADSLIYRKHNIPSQAQLEKEAEEDNQYRQQLEQERRDHELALRLAQESNSQVDDSPMLMRKYESAIILKFCVQIHGGNEADIYCPIHFMHV